MKGEEYHAAAQPELFSVLRFRLRTYSLGHHLLLHRIESPFVAGGSPDYDDLALAVLICSMSYEDACRAIQSPLLRAMLKWMSFWALGKLNPLYWIGFKKARCLSLLDECALLTAHMNRGNKMPHFGFDESAVGPVPIPAVHAVRVALLSKTGMSETQVMNRGWQLCRLDYHLIQAQEGTIQIRDKGEDDDARRVANLAAAMVADGRIKLP